MSNPAMTSSSRRYGLKPASAAARDARPGCAVAAHNPRRGTVATYSAGQVGYARSTYVTVGGAAGTGTHRERARTQ